MLERAAGLEARPGSYILWLELAEACELAIGRFARTGFAAGAYAYVGSALGPGGVRARLGRHLAGGGSPRWHIDYLRAACVVRAAWIRYDSARLEHLWAQALMALPGAKIPLEGFGSSDCDCKTHLVAFRRQPEAAAMLARLSRPCPPVLRFCPDL